MWAPSSKRWRWPADKAGSTASSARLRRQFWLPSADCRLAFINFDDGRILNCGDEAASLSTDTCFQVETAKGGPQVQEGEAKCFTSHTWLQSRIVREDEGATMVEYGLMVALIAVVVDRCRDPRRRRHRSAAVHRPSQASSRLKRKSAESTAAVLDSSDRRSSSQEGLPHMITRFLTSEDGAIHAGVRPDGDAHRHGGVWSRCMLFGTVGERSLRPARALDALRD